MNSDASFLTRLPLFADVSPEMLARLEHPMRRREFAPRSVIVGEGSSDDSAFLVLSGRVAVQRTDWQLRMISSDWLRQAGWRALPSGRAEPVTSVVSVDI